MKKKIFLGFVASLLVFSSCLKSDIEMPPTYGGAKMYGEVKLHNNYVVFCAELVYKLNMLLEERIGLQPLEDVIVRLSREGDSLLQDIGVRQLFKGMNVSFEELENGVWRVGFKPGVGGNSYDGAVLISTEGKLLSVVGASWAVTNDPILGMSYDQLGMDMSVLGGVKVAHLEQDKFWVYVNDFGLYWVDKDPEMKEKSKWSLDLYISKNSSDYSLLGMRSSVYEVVGKSQGTIIGYGGKVTSTYRIDDNVHAPSPLKYKYSEKLNKVVLFSGTEIVNTPGLSLIDPFTFPAAEAVIVWGATVNGNIYYDLTYNGHTTTTRPLAESESDE